MDLLKETGFLDEKGYVDLFQDVDEIAGMLFSVFKPSGRVRAVSCEQLAMNKTLHYLL